MGLQFNLLRRGATYAWRKRLPLNLGYGLIQINLRTNDPKIAKRVAAVVSAESTHIFDSMKTHALTKPDARRLLTAVIEGELARVSHARTVSLDDPSPFAWQIDRSNDWAYGASATNVCRTWQVCRNAYDARSPDVSRRREDR